MADEPDQRKLIHPAAFVVDTETLRVVVRDAVRGEFEQFGLFQGEADHVRADMIHLRQWRETMDTMKQAGIAAAVKWSVLAVIALLLVGIGVKFGVKIPVID